MSVLVPLAVRVKNGRVDKRITNRVRDLSFGSVCPGGFASATFSLDSPLALGAPELDPFTRVYVYDTHTAQTVWQGWLEEPGRGVGSDGQVWSVTAMGPSARAQDLTEPLVYVERSLDGWHRTNNSVPEATSGVSANPSSTDDQVLLLSFPPGSLITTGSTVNLTNTVLTDAGLELGGVGWYNQMGSNTPATYELQCHINGTSAGALGFSTTLSALNTVSVNNDFTIGGSTPMFRATRIGGGATTVAVSTVWAAVIGVWIRMKIYDKTGAQIIEGRGGENDRDYLLASTVVKDLLGRLLVNFDGANATVATTAFHIDQLSYPDGVTSAQVLDDLMVLEPAYYWAAWEGDLARFEWAAWPTTVTYEADVNDGYSASNSSEGLYNRAVVRWKDKKGNIQSSRYSQAVGVLTDAGIVRRAWIDLGDEVGSQANADRVGANFLADHAVAANAGTLTVARGIRNLTTGRVEQPWEVKPGTLIRVRGMPAEPGPLNATGSDGVSVMRIVSTDYNASANTVTLELDTYTRSMTRALNQRKRRR